jgi:hypothetical protein
MPTEHAWKVVHRGGDLVEIEFVRNYRDFLTSHPELEDIGPFTQRWTEGLLRTIFPSSDVLGEIRFGRPERELVDVLVVHRDAWLFIQCKGRQPSLEKPPYDLKALGDWIEKRTHIAKGQFDIAKGLLQSGDMAFVMHGGSWKPLDFAECPRALFVVIVFAFVEIGVTIEVDARRRKHPEIQIVDLLELAWLARYLSADELVRYLREREELFRSGKAVSFFDRNLLLFFLSSKNGFLKLIEAADPLEIWDEHMSRLDEIGFSSFEYHHSLDSKVVERNKELFRRIRNFL